MPSIVLTDAAPAARTFDAAIAQPDYSMFENRAGGVVVGFDKLSFRLNRPSGNTRGGQARNLKLISLLEMPLLETEVTYVYGPDWTTAPTVSHRPRIETRFTMPERTTTSERQDIVAMHKDLMAEAIYTSFLEDFILPS